MYAYQVIAVHSEFWVMLTIFVILAPNGRSTARVAVLWVASTLAGVLSVHVGERLVDTLIGAALALAAAYLLWPRSGGSTAGPAALAEEAVSAGITTEGTARAH